MTWLGDKLIGNFRRQGPRIKVKSRRLERPGMSKPHLELIRLMPCCVTLVMPCREAHHLKNTGERGMGMRSTDKWAVPLSHDPHMDCESVGSRGEIAWFKRHGIEDPHALAIALWAASGDLSKMVKILYAHRGIS